MQIRQNSAKRLNLDIKTSSPDTQSLRVQMPECVNYHRKMTLSWQQVLSHKYQYHYQYQWSKYQYQYPVQQDWLVIN